MDTAQWPQGIVVKPSNGTTNPQKSAGGKINSAKEGVNCPRCNSTNTKFCYYNNYSLTQPRYFCKTCRRYWTEGGTLRNIPVGGGSRKNKRPSSSNSTSFSSSSSLSSNTAKQLLPGLVSSSSNNYSAAPSLPSSTKIAAPQNPKMMMMNQEEGQDLNGQLAFPRSFTELMHHHHQVQPSITVDDHDHQDRNNQVSALELLNRSSGGLNINSGSFMHSHDHGHGQDAGFDNYTSGLSFLQHQDFKPSSSSCSSLSFSLDGVGDGINGNGGLGRPPLLFPFEDLKQVPTTAGNGKANDDHDDHGRSAADSSGYWTGMLGGGSW